MPVVNLISDFDGTIADSEYNWIRLFSGVAGVLKRYGSGLSDEALFRIVEDEDLKSAKDWFNPQFSVDELVKGMCQQAGIPYSVKVLEECKEQARLLTLPCGLRKGIQQIIGEDSPLRAEHGYSLYVVSDVPRLWIERTLGHHSIIADGIISAEEHGTRDKKLLYSIVLSEDSKNIIIGDRPKTDIRPGNELKDKYDIVTIWYPYRAKRLRWWSLKCSQPENVVEIPDYTVSDGTIYRVFQAELF